MILACQESIWTFGRWCYMPVDRVYTAEPTLHASAQSRHAVLSELDDNEFTQFIERRLDGSCARQARLLLSPERYRLLRHPYFLDATSNSIVRTSAFEARHPSRVSTGCSRPAYQPGSITEAVSLAVCGTIFGRWLMH